MKKGDKIIICIFVGILILSLVSILFLDKIFSEPEDMVYVGLNSAESFQISNSRLGTNPGAPITMEYFLDFNCGYTASMQSTLFRVMQVYGKNLNVIVRHYPQFDGSELAAEASECARDQNAFWKYHNLLLQNTLSLDKVNLVEYANELGLDLDKFKGCLDSGEKSLVVQDDKKYANDNFVQGTPTFIIDGFQLKGTVDYSRFKEIIDEEMKNAQG